MSLESTIDAIIRPSLEHMDYGLVQVKMVDVLGNRTLQIMAEKLDGSQINVDDCATISRTVSALLDVEDPISGAYHLEVSSPGIDRPLVSLADYEKYAGFEAKLETQIPINGRKRYKGVVKGIDGEKVLVEVDQEIFEIAHRDIATAKLILTDALLKAYQDNKVNH